jgi:hypothetical protein
VAYDALLRDLILLADTVALPDLCALDDNTEIRKYYRAALAGCTPDPRASDRLLLLTWWLLRYIHYPHVRVGLDRLPAHAREQLAANTVVPRYIIQFQ